MIKRIFVVSDVHGHYDIMKQALEMVGYDSQNQEHFLVCCGDFFDRGEQNLEVLRFFERVRNGVLLRGNHEDLLLKLLQTGKVLPHNYINGTLKTLESFFGKYSIDPVDDTIDFSGKTRMVDRACEFIENTVNYFETRNYVFVHGWLAQNAETAERRKNITDAEWEKARWEKWTDRYTGQRPLEDKILICGHVPTFYAGKFDKTRTKGDSEIFFGNGVIAIDAGTDDSKRVNVLVIEDELI